MVAGGGAGWGCKVDIIALLLETYDVYQYQNGMLMGSFLMTFFGKTVRSLIEKAQNTRRASSEGIPRDYDEAIKKYQSASVMLYY